MWDTFAQLAAPYATAGNLKLGVLALGGIAVVLVFVMSFSLLVSGVKNYVVNVVYFFAISAGVAWLWMQYLIFTTPGTGAPDGTEDPSKPSVRVLVRRTLHELAAMI